MNSSVEEIVKNKTLDKTKKNSNKKYVGKVYKKPIISKDIYEKIDENTDKKTLVAIGITTLAVIYIFKDSFERGDVLGNFLGLICATGLAGGAVIIRSGKKMPI